MHLQQRTDFALRLLIHLSLCDPEPASVQRVAEAYGISAHHLSKVAQRLRELGYLEAVRGRNGGFRLARAASKISVGSVVRQVEELTLVECFDRDANRCVITGACGLRSALRAAQQSFLESLDAHTVADLVAARRPALVRTLGIRTARRAASA